MEGYDVNTRISRSWLLSTLLFLWLFILRSSIQKSIPGIGFLVMDENMLFFIFQGAEVTLCYEDYIHLLRSVFIEIQWLFLFKEFLYGCEIWIDVQCDERESAVISREDSYIPSPSSSSFNETYIFRFFPVAPKMLYAREATKSRPKIPNSIMEKYIYNHTVPSPSPPTPSTYPHPP